MLEARIGLAEAAAVVLLASISSGIAYSAVLMIPTEVQAVPVEVAEMAKAFRSPPFVLTTSVVSGIVGWLLVGCIFHLSSKALGGRASLEQTLFATGYAQAPGTFLLAFGLLAWVTASPVVHSGFSLLISLWIVALLVLGLREAHGFSTGRAFAAIVIPAAVLIAIVIAAILFAMMMLPLALPAA